MRLCAQKKLQCHPIASKFNPTSFQVSNKLNLTYFSGSVSRCLGCCDADKIKHRPFSEVAFTIPPEQFCSCQPLCLRYPQVLTVPTEHLAILLEVALTPTRPKLTST